MNQTLPSEEQINTIVATLDRIFEQSVQTKNQAFWNQNKIVYSNDKLGLPRIEPRPQQTFLMGKRSKTKNSKSELERVLFKK